MWASSGCTWFKLHMVIDFGYEEVSDITINCYKVAVITYSRDNRWRRVHLYSGWERMT